MEHWLNGIKVLAHQLGSQKAKVAMGVSKLNSAPGYGDKITGQLTISYHAEKSWFGKVKIREPLPERKALMIK